jgi:putative transcriptional regulator
MIICTMKQVLKRKGWTRYRLEKESGITFPTLHAMFYGKSKGYTGDILNRLCATLQCKPGDLLKWEPDRFPRHRKPRK